MRQGRNRGQAVVELAIVVPLILLLLLGIVAFGRVLSHSILVTNAAREGARHGALGQPDEQIVEAIKRETTSLDQSQLWWKITPPDDHPDRVQGQKIKVEVWYNDRLPVPLLNILLSPRTLYGRAIMVIQKPTEQETGGG